MGTITTKDSTQTFDVLVDILATKLPREELHDANTERALALRQVS